MKYLSILIISLVFCQVSQAQSNRKNSVYIDLAGPMVVGIGLSYGRYFSIHPKMHLTARAGGGSVKHFSEFSGYFGGSFLYGKRSNLEIGFNEIFNIDGEAFRDPDTIGPNYEENAFQMLMGYRYNNEKSGVMFRVYLVPPIGKFSNLFGIPSGGLSIGYSF